jgi:hypothetical protein
MKADDKPDHRDAELVLRVYELRRESVLREARAAISQKFRPKSFADVQAVLKPDHPLNAAYRQVSSYWEMVYGMVKHGIVHDGYFMESNGEGMLLFAKVAPFVEDLRRDHSPVAFQNAEWVSKNTAVGRRAFETMASRVKKALARDGVGGR